MPIIIFRGYKLETRKRVHDWAARVTDPDGATHLFIGPDQKSVEQQGRDFIKGKNPFRDEDEEGPEAA